MSTGTKNEMRFGTSGRSHEELKRDRKTAIVVVVIMLAVMALTIWLASFGNAPVQNGIDYWPMMP